jgi:hypothetical protein
MHFEKIQYQWPIAENTFLIVIHRFSFVKASMNAVRICKMRNGLSKTASISSFFNCLSVQ